MRKSNWTTKEIDMLKTFYLSKSIEWMCDGLGKEKQSIYTMASRLKLKKENTGRFKTGQVKNINTQFKPGMKPWNVGTKGLTSANSGSFKKGNTPHNTCDDGDERVHVDSLNGRRYKIVRICTNHWEFVHRINYEQKYGEIPDGYIVTFKDGNTMNTNIDNLELLSRKENMLRNIMKRYPEELQQTIRLITQLNKQLKTLEK